MQEDDGSRKTILETILCLLPFLLYPINLFYIVLYWLNLSMPSLLISSFPESYRNPFTILACLAIEMIMLFYYLTLCAYIMHFIITSTLTMKTTIQVEAKKIQWVFWQSYSDLHKCSTIVSIKKFSDLPLFFVIIQARVSARIFLWASMGSWEGWVSFWGSSTPLPLLVSS